MSDFGKFPVIAIDEDYSKIKEIYNCDFEIYNVDFGLQG